MVEWLRRQTFNSIIAISSVPDLWRSYHFDQLTDLKLSKLKEGLPK